MALDVVQGTLPYDQEKVDPAAFLEAWINGTRVWNLPAGAFKGGTIQFVVSTTEAPPLAERFAGLLWFARGEGRLYIWDKPDAPSALTFSDVNWICLSDRRELWCWCAEGTIPLGAPCKFLETNNTVATDLITNSDQSVRSNNDPYPRPLWRVHSASNGSGATNTLSDVCFVARETGQSGGLFRVVELGICNILCSSGETGNQGAMVVDETRPGMWWRRDPTCGSLCPLMAMAECLDSSATAPAGEWLRPVFKHQAPLLGIASTV